MSCWSFRSVVHSLVTFYLGLHNRWLHRQRCAMLVLSASFGNGGDTPNTKRSECKRSVPFLDAAAAASRKSLKQWTNVQLMHLGGLENWPVVLLVWRRKVTFHWFYEWSIRRLGKSLRMYIYTNKLYYKSSTWHWQCDGDWYISVYICVVLTLQGPKGVVNAPRISIGLFPVVILQLNSVFEWIFTYSS